MWLRDDAGRFMIQLDTLTEPERRIRAVFQAALRSLAWIASATSRWTMTVMSAMLHLYPVVS
jgi:hypothetical protein